MSELLHNLQRLSEDRSSYVMITLTGIRGSAPQVVGSKMLVGRDGLIWGTVGGGKIELHCIKFAMQLLEQSGSPQSHTWNLQKDIGMSCGGEVSIFFDPVLYQNWNVCIFGAGHIAQELCRVLQTWSCQIQIFDTRAEWLEKLPSSHNIRKKLSENLAEEVKHLPEDAYLLCMTQGHATDFPILLQAYQNPKHFSFIGVIGSDIKAIKVKKQLIESGISEEFVHKLGSPLGLPIGNNTPPEIAISVASQLLVLRDKIDLFK